MSLFSRVWFRYITTRRFKRIFKRYGQGYSRRRGDIPPRIARLMESEPFNRWVVESGYLRWTVNLTAGGRVEIPGVLSEAEAIAYVGAHLKHLTIIDVDNVYGMIFAKASSG